MARLAPSTLRLLRELGEKGVNFVLAGGQAVILHGVFRTSHDLDISVSLEPANLNRFTELMGELGYKIQQPVSLESIHKPGMIDKWIKEKNLTVLTFADFSSEGKPTIDIMIEPGARFSDLSKEAHVVDFGDGALVRIISLSELITLKERAVPFHPKHEMDLQQLKEIQNGKQ